MKLVRKISKMKSLIFNKKFFAANAMLEDHPSLMWKISSNQRRQLLNHLK